MKNQSAKSPADEFEVGKAAPAAQTATPAPSEKPKLAKPAPPPPKITKVEPHQEDPSVVRYNGALPATFKEAHDLLVKLEAEQPLANRKAELARIDRLKKVKQCHAELQQTPRPPNITADNHHFARNAPKRRRELADKLRSTLST